MPTTPPLADAHRIGLPAARIVAVDLPVAIVVDTIETSFGSLQIARPPPILA
jgi:hypothetical protein